MRVGPYTVQATVDAPPAQGPWPLVVISHGNSGSPWTHRGLATHLARHGFAVALPLHTGNNHRENHLHGTAELLRQRPADVRAAIDTAWADPLLGPRLASAVGVVGHSFGGYTALALVGGRPRCHRWEAPDGVEAAVPVQRDPRVAAVVLLAPATPWYRAPDALTAVDVPILMRTAEHDRFTPAWHGRIVLDGLPPDAAIDHAVVPGAGHFAFQSPFPPAMCRPGFPPAADPPGFDRAAYQPRLCDEVTAFLRRTLAHGAVDRAADLRRGGLHG